MNPKESNSGHLQLRLRIDWSDQDLFGHVNNLSFFRYIQSARVNLWDFCGIPSGISEKGTGPLLASCQCEFKAPLYYPGEVVIHSSVIQIGNSSFKLRHLLHNSDRKIVAEATDVIVMYHFAGKQKAGITEVVREKMNRIIVDMNTEA